MDMDELILEALSLAETHELNCTGSPKIYTCILPTDSPLWDERSIFAEIVMKGEVCVCACDANVASLIYFLMQGVFDHSKDRNAWYLNILSNKFNMQYDDMSAEDAMAIWTNEFEKTCITEHNILQPIIIKSEKLNNEVIKLTPSICDIWTLPRIRRQFTE